LFGEHERLRVLYSKKIHWKFRGFLGRHTLRMSTGGMNHSSIYAKGKGNSKAFRASHGQ
jgi:hypothetical protein